MAIGGNTALDPFRKPAINLQREGSSRSGTAHPRRRRPHGAKWTQLISKEHGRKPHSRPQAVTPNTSSVEIAGRQSTLVAPAQRIEADMALAGQVRFDHVFAEGQVLRPGFLALAQPPTTAGLHPVLPVRALSQRSA